MEGTRKLKGYYVATAVLTASFFFTVLMAALFPHLAIDLTSAFNMYLLSEGSATAVFFGMNGVEHWSNNRPQTKP